MMARARTPKERWVEAGLQELAAGGPEAVRVEVLAKRLGVTKGGFYGFFADREDLLKAMLDSWEKQVSTDVLEKLDDADPQQRAMRAQALTFDSSLFPTELAIREWSRRDPDVAQRLHRVDAQRMELLREAVGRTCSEPIEIEARSSLAFYTAIGSHFVTVDHGEIDPKAVDAFAASLLLGEQNDTKEP
ncbi:TetR/AcrR family transcriptional regulator [Brevibacterium linens]|nr:TetR/AcrR family transcriptional regulator [Brevibacterium linens]